MQLYEDNIISIYERQWKQKALAKIISKLNKSMRIQFKKKIKKSIFSKVPESY